jgi:hypothetical protein
MKTPELVDVAQDGEPAHFVACHFWDKLPLGQAKR